MGNFRGFRNNNNRDFKRREMHKTICSKCGSECEVPFIPTGEKPVFCNNCFEKKDSSEPRRFNDRNFRRGNYSDRQMHSAVCDSCGSKCEVPFMPTSGKPVYCDRCFKKNSGSANQNTDQFKEQFAKLNAKLDRILQCLTPVSAIKAAPVEKRTPKPKKPAKKLVLKK